MSKIKVGVIGCGFISKKWHIPTYLTLNGKVEVSAVCDVSPQAAASVAKEFGVSRSYSNPSEMLEKESLDLVDICTPPATHASLSIEAMEHGCNVLLEKPMALNISDCDEMVRVSQKQNKKLCIIHNELFRPPMLKAKKIVEAGEIGKLVGMHWCRFTHQDEYLNKADHWIHKLPGGLIGEIAPHAVYTSLAFLKTVKSVGVVAKNNFGRAWAPFDYFDITLEGEDLVSSVIICNATSNYIADIDIYGADEMLKLDMQNMLLLRHRLGQTKPVPLAKSLLKPAGQMIGNVASNAVKMTLKRSTMMSVIGHATEITMFVDSIIDDTKPPVTAEEGREVIRVMDMLIKEFYRKYPKPTATKP